MEEFEYDSPKTSPFTRAKSFGILVTPEQKEDHKQLARSLESSEENLSNLIRLNTLIPINNGSYDDDDIKFAVRNIVGWSETDQLELRQYTGGLSNKLIRVTGPPLEDHEGEAGWSPHQLVVLCRIYGEKTEELIDREIEMKVILALYEEGLAPKFYGTFGNGMVYGHFRGHPLINTQLGDLKYSELIANRLAQFHGTHFKVDGMHPANPSVWATIQKWAANLRSGWSAKREADNLSIDASWIHSTLQSLQTTLNSLNSTVVFSHNDLLAGNVIYDEVDNIVRFIDYEYASYNPRGFDIGNHFNEYGGPDLAWSLFPDKETKTRFAKAYLKAMKLGDSPEEVERLVYEATAFTLASNLYWGVWALIQAQNSTIDFDFESYGTNRLFRIIDTWHFLDH